MLVCAHQNRNSASSGHWYHNKKVYRTHINITLCFTNTSKKVSVYNSFQCLLYTWLIMWHLVTTGRYLQGVDTSFGREDEENIHSQLWKCRLEVHHVPYNKLECWIKKYWFETWGNLWSRIEFITRCTVFLIKI